MSANHKNRNMSNQELEQMLSAMNGMKVPQSSRSKEDAWKMLMQSAIEQETQARVVPMKNTRIWFAVAASVVIFIVAGWSFIKFSTVTEYCPMGQIADVVLPDGSKVTLNADSKIVYPKYFSFTSRNIKLTGEAFFTVNQGKKFTVTDLHNRKVEVVGTEFNVKSRGESFKVFCYDGKVNVLIPENTEVKLNKGDGVEAVNKHIKTLTLPVDSVSKPMWFKGEFYFDSTNLSDVIAELERQFNIVIFVDGFNPSERTYTGYFSNLNLKNALDLVTLPMGLNYEVNADSSKVNIRN